jgi:hypothetical protein
MRGDDQVRFCGKCRLNVYNLSGMSRRQAEALLGRSEGRVCVRFYRRPDGTVMTRDCGTVARGLARSVLAIICTFLALILMGTAAGVGWVSDIRWPGYFWANEVVGLRAELPPGPPDSPTGAPAVPAVMGEPMAPREVLLGNIARPRAENAR